MKNCYGNIRRMATAIKCVSNCSTMEELVELFDSKISMLRKGMEIRKLDYNGCVCLRSLERDVSELRILLDEMRIEIEKQQDQLKILETERTRIREVDRKVTHAMENFPASLEICKQPPSQKADFCETKVKPEIVSQPQQQKGVKKIPSVMPLSLSEFQKIPKYMRGRLTCDNINTYISSLNKAVQNKYQILSTPRSQLGPAEFKKVQEMRSLETPETKGLYFCVSEDLKTYGNFKSEKDIKNIATILRHCSRIREIRGPGPVLRFVVIDCNF